MPKGLRIGEALRPPPTHRNEFPTGYSLTGCSPAEPVSAFPAALILRRSFRKVQNLWTPESSSLQAVSRKGAVQGAVHSGHPPAILRASSPGKRLTRNPLPAKESHAGSPDCFHYRVCRIAAWSFRFRSTACILPRWDRRWRNVATLPNRAQLPDYQWTMCVFSRRPERSGSPSR